MRKAVLNLLARPAQSLRWIWFGAALLSVLPVSLAGEVAALRWGTGVLKQPDAWYATPYARSAADNLLLYQSPVGAWPKNTDLLAPATPEALAEVEKGGKADTIDNGATTLPLRFLARIAAATGEPRYLEAARRGVDYLLAAQYPNGGFPQFYPLRKGYYSHVTFNDGAMIHALQVLRDVAQGRAPFEFLDDEHRSRAGAAVSRGIDCILKTQVRQEGRPTVWCAQYDENTLEPAWARKYEPPSLSGAESVGAVRFLMAVEDPSPELIAAVEGAVAWFRSVAISGKRLDRIKRADGRTERLLVDDPSAPPLWARFYELGTNRPLYMDRNSEPVYDFAQIAYERRSGYDYHTEAPATLLDRDYPVWRERRAKAPAPPVPERHRVVVTSDIGGTDPDDYQSMAHLLLCADTLEIEGLISSPFEREGKDKILEVIDAYARDFPNLRTLSAAYPEP